MMELEKHHFATSNEIIHPGNEHLWMELPSESGWEALPGKDCTVTICVISISFHITNTRLSPDMVQWKYSA